MPSGKPVNWEEFDHLILSHLPSMTIEDFAKAHLQHISTKAIGARARKLNVKPKAYQLTKEHKQKIADIITKIGDDELQTIRELRDSHSVDKIAEILGVDELTIHRTISKHKIKLTKVGKARALAASRIACVGIEPWNKGSQLSGETKKKISDATSGEKNSQYGKGMIEEEKEKWRATFFSRGVFKIKEWLQSEVGQQLLAANAAKQATPEARLANSLRSSELMRIGVLKPGWSAGNWLETIKGGHFFAKSSYESRYVEILEASDEVECFAYEPFRIQYEFNNIQLYYIPDFLVKYRDGREELVEVKPKKMVDWPKNAAKIAAGKEYHINFRIVTEDELFED